MSDPFVALVGSVAALFLLTTILGYVFGFGFLFMDLARQQPRSCLRTMGVISCALLGLGLLLAGQYGAGAMLMVLAATGLLFNPKD